MKIRKLVLIIICVLLAFPALQSCKKGANDPAISLIARTARLAAEWTITKAIIIEVDGSDMETWTHDDGSVIVTYSDGTPTETGTYIWEMTINKDGSFTGTRSYTFSGNTMTVDIEGTWFWASNNKDLDIKSKEMVMIRVNKETVSMGGTTEITTYEGGNLTGYLIDMLKNKEMVWKYENVYNGNSTSRISEELTFTAD